jgi:hypothetical protein
MLRRLRGSGRGPVSLRHEILFDLGSLGDESCRGISWDLDAPGRGAYVRYSLRF